MERGLDNCSLCEQYVCEKLSGRLVAYDEVKKRIGVEIPEEDYNSFIRPYENRKRLDALRDSEKKV
jgi:hypothetical protein